MLSACGAGTRRGVHTRGYIFTVDTQCVTNLFTHSNIRLPPHRWTMRIDTILLMWAVAENVKFRVCSSSRFSNGAHARRRCFYRKFDSAFREIKVLQCRPYFPVFCSAQSFLSFLFSLESPWKILECKLAKIATCS